MMLNAARHDGVHAVRALLRRIVRERTAQSLIWRPAEITTAFHRITLEEKCSLMKSLFDEKYVHFQFEH